MSCTCGADGCEADRRTRNPRPPCWCRDRLAAWGIPTPDHLLGSGVESRAYRVLDDPEVVVKVTKYPEPYARALRVLGPDDWKVIARVRWVSPRFRCARHGRVAAVVQERLPHRGSDKPSIRVYDADPVQRDPAWRDRVRNALRRMDATEIGDLHPGNVRRRTPRGPEKIIDLGDITHLREPIVRWSNVRRGLTVALRVTNMSA